MLRYKRELTSFEVVLDGDCSTKLVALELYVARLPGYAEDGTLLHVPEVCRRNFDLCIGERWSRVAHCPCKIAANVAVQKCCMADVDIDCEGIEQWPDRHEIAAPSLQAQHEGRGFYRWEEVLVLPHADGAIRQCMSLHHEVKGRDDWTGVVVTIVALEVPSQEF